MKPNEKMMLKEWSAQAGLSRIGTHFVIDYDEQIPRTVMRLDRLVADLANSKNELFEVSARGGKLRAITEVAKRVLECVDLLNTAVVREYLTRHRFSPYFELWEEYEHQLEQAVWIAREALEVEPLNRCIDEIRAKARASEFRTVVRNQERAARKNWASLQQFFQRIFSETARPLVVRLDVGYRSGPAEFGSNWEKPEDGEVKDHLDQLLRFIRRKVPNRVGDVWKIEYGASKGHHVHILVVCDGHLSQKGFPIAQMIGEKWKEITGTGSFWNCNGSEALFKRRGQLGIGLINYWDEEARKNLLNVGLYVAKADYYVRFISPAFGRTFGKSLAKDSEAPNRLGRPRKYVDPLEGVDNVEQVKKLA